MKTTHTFSLAIPACVLVAFVLMLGLGAVHSQTGANCNLSYLACLAFAGAVELLIPGETAIGHWKHERSRG